MQASQAPPGPPDPQGYALLANPELRLYLAARFASGLGFQLFRAALLWQVYEQTGSTYYLGAIGVAQFIPTLALSLFAGAITDRYDRRAIAIAAQTVACVVSVGLALATLGGQAGTALIFSVIALEAAAAAFENPAGAALLPSLVSRGSYSSAVALMSSVRNVSWVSGPALAGLIIKFVGVFAAYSLHAALLGLSIALLVPLRPRPPERASAVDMDAIREGIRFVWSRPEILGAMALDMLAVIFAGSYALLPVFAKDILGVGAEYYGLLGASFQGGTVLVALLLISTGKIQRLGRVLLLSVAAYAAATVAFGLSRSFWLSLLCYALAGMADQVSVVARSTLIQLATPDGLRGRVSAVNFIFIGASNYLGAAEAGLVAGLTSAPFAVVSGGLVALVICGVIAQQNRTLREYRLSA